MDARARQASRVPNGLQQAGGYVAGEVAANVAGGRLLLQPVHPESATNPGTISATSTRERLHTSDTVHDDVRTHS